MIDDFPNFADLLSAEKIFSVAFLFLVWASVKGIREDFWPTIRELVIPAWRDDSKERIQILQQLAMNQAYILQELRRIKFFGRGQDLDDL